MIKNRNNNIQKKNGGYTLVEMIVVLVIMGILAGLAIGGIMAYQRHAAFKKNNEYAKTIFISAQNALTHVKATGQIDDLEEELKKDGKSTISKEDIDGAYENEIVPEDRIYSVIFPKSRETLTDTEQKIYDLIAPYVYDEEIMDASFSIEFDPADGTVWGVCYNDKASVFSYSGENTIKNNNISLRSEADRRKVLLGYYGVDMLSDRVPEGSREDIIKKAELVNEDTLHASWILDRAFKDNNYDYDFQITKGVGTEPVCKFKIDRNKLKGIASDGVPVQIKCDVEIQDGSKLQDVPFLAYKYVDEAGETVFNLVLDAVDFNSNTQLNEQAGGGDADYKKSYSILRLMPDLLESTNEGRSRAASMEAPVIGSMYLYVSIQASDDNVVSEQKITNPADALFGTEGIENAEIPDSTDTIKTVTYSIDNIRHLYNIRFAEAALKKAEADKGNVAYVYRQQSRKVAGTISGEKLITGDVRWSKSDDGSEESGIVDSGWVFSSCEPVAVSDDKPSKTITFPAVNELGKKSSYIGIGGVDDPKLAVDNKAVYSVSGINLLETEAKVPLGIFKKNSGSISNTTLISARVNGKQSVGTVCGINAGTLTKVSVDKTSMVSGERYVGGITGADVTALKDSATDVSPDRVYAELSNAGNVSGKSYVGGILGYNYKLAAGGSSVIQSCTNTGYVQSTEQNGICIGGIVGYNRLADITECKSNPVGTAYDNNKAKEFMKGQFVGGIVGFNRGGKIVNSITGSENEAERGFISGYQYVGGIAGVSTNNFSDGAAQMLPLAMDAGSQEKKSVSRINAAGNSYVGGITGINAVITASGTTIDEVLNEKAAPDKLTIASAPAGNQYKLAGFEYTGNIYGAANLGGITGYNSGAVENCTVGKINLDGKRRFGSSVSSAMDTSCLGGITGSNMGMVTNCSVADISMAGAGTNIGQYGGITGINTASVKDSTAQSVKVADSTDWNAAVPIGGIAGDSLGTIENSSAVSVSGRDRVGGIAQANSGTITNCTSGTVTASGSNVGGTANTNTRDIDNCTANIVVSSGDNIGGVASANSGTVRNSSSNNVTGANVVGGVVASNNGQTEDSSAGNVTGRNYVGGIISKNADGAYLMGCQVKNNSAITGTGDYIGGMVAENAGEFFDRSVSVDSSIKVSGNNSVGGMIGIQKKKGASLSGFVNNAELNGSSDVGGLIGTLDSGLMLSSSSNSGNITSRTNGGGIIGKIAPIGDLDLYKGSPVGISDCVNTGILYGDTNRGGIIGYIEPQPEGKNSDISLNRCVNTGAIQEPASDLSCAGLIGKSMITASSQKVLIIQNSDNYGMPSYGAAYPMSGIIGRVADIAPTILYSCYGVVQSGYPITSMELYSPADDKQNYFFVQPLRTGEAVPLGKVRVQKIDDNQENDDSMFDDKASTSLQRQINSTGKMTILIKAPGNAGGNGVAVRNIDLFWLGSGVNYKYDITLSGKDEYGSQCTETIADQYGMGSPGSNMTNVARTEVSACIYPSEITITIYGRSGSAVGIKEMYFNGLPANASSSTKPIISLPQNKYPNTQGKWGFGVPLYTQVNGGAVDAYKFDGSRMIQGMRVDPAAIVSDPNIVTTSSNSKTYYGWLKDTLSVRK